MGVQENRLTAAITTQTEVATITRTAVTLMETGAVTMTRTVATMTPVVVTVTRIGAVIIGSIHMDAAQQAATKEEEEGEAINHTLDKVHHRLTTHVRCTHFRRRTRDRLRCSSSRRTPTVAGLLLETTASCKTQETSPLAVHLTTHHRCMPHIPCPLATATLLLPCRKMMWL